MEDFREVVPWHREGLCNVIDASRIVPADLHEVQEGP